MLVLPISMIISLALGFLLLRAVRAGRSFWPIPALLTACAAQGAIIALAQHYAVPSMRFVQPVTATTIPSLAWLAFRTTTLRPFDVLRDWLHLGVPAFTVFCVLFAPQTLDGVVSAIFVAYGLAMIHALRSGADGLPLIRLEAGDWPPRIWRTIAVLLLLSALGDGVIATAQALGGAWLQPWIVNIMLSLSLLLIGCLTLSQSLEGGEADLEPEERPPLPQDAERDAEIIRRLDAILSERTLFLDPALTLSRLARRLGMPAKTLSATINRATGQNVSRYVNAYRVHHACDRLRAGCSVTAAMLESGFNTKSNFNREFLRVTGRSPTTWLAETVASPPPAVQRDGADHAAHRLSHRL